MPNLLTFTADRRILFYSAAMVAIGTLLGTIATSAALLGRMHEAETVTRSLKDLVALQSSRITSLTALSATDSNSVRTQATPAPASTPTAPSAPSVETPLRSPTNAAAPASTLFSEPTSLPTLAIPTASATAPVVATSVSNASNASSTSGAPSAVKVQPDKIPANPPPRLVAKVVQRPAPPKNSANSAADTRLIAPTTKVVTAGLSQPANGAKEAIPALPAPSAAAATVATVATVTLEQAGITGLDSSGVRFKSGRLISVGSEFPSGEKLLSVNPADGRIVTDRRVIVVAKPQLEK